MRSAWSLCWRVSCQGLSMHACFESKRIIMKLLHREMPVACSLAFCLLNLFLKGIVNKLQAENLKTWYASSLGCHDARSAQLWMFLHYYAPRIDTAPTNPQPPIRETTPEPGSTTQPNPTPSPPVRFCYHPAKVLEDGRKNWEKINFPLRFFYVNFNIFSKFQILIDFSPNPQKLASNLLNFF